MTEYRFIEPLDVLYLRGNKLFGDAGSYGEALMPPWPSLAAGALRSRMLADHGVDLAAFAQARDRLPGLSDALHACLGTPQKPGNFRVSLFTLACREQERVQPCFPLPADVVVTAKALDNATYLQPTAPHSALSSSYALAQAPLLRADDPAKPQGNLWLNAAGLGAYLNGEQLGKEHLLRGGELWQFDHRLGIALNGAQRTVAKGMLYTAQTVALNRRDGSNRGRDAGFLIGVDGADGLLPKDGLLRFGGDGRGAALQEVSPKNLLPAPDGRRIEQEAGSGWCWRRPACSPTAGACPVSMPTTAGKGRTVARRGWSRRRFIAPIRSAAGIWRGGNRNRRNASRRWVRCTGSTISRARPRRSASLPPKVSGR